MKHLRTIALTIWLCLPLAGIGTLHGNALASSHEIDFKAIDRYTTAQMRAARIPGLTLGIVKGDRIVYLNGYGRADSSGRPVTPKTPFIIGSVTKAFTALAVMQLVEAGKVELDAPVLQYLPWFRVADPQASAHITVRQLLTMTSGISANGSIATQMWTGDDDKALERHVRFLENVKMDYPAGQSFEYSNANYLTLGAIVQAASGQSYEEYIKQHIFTPLDMKNSFVSQDEAIKNGMAMGHRWWFGFPIAVTLPYNRGDLPAGYVISSGEDMAHFLIAQMNGGRYRDISVLAPDGIALMHTEPVPNTYGMGWESARINGRTVIDHDGGKANFQSSVFFDPEERVGVFVAANVINALDTFSSPHGSSLLDGPTARAMAESVLSLATDQPLPEQGPGIVRLSLIFDLVILVLTIVLVISLARIPGRRQRLAKRGIPRWPRLAWSSGLTAALHFSWPLFVLYLALKVPAWKVAFLFQPDLGYWLEAVATVVFLKGLLEINLTWRVFRKSRLNNVL